MQNSTFQELLAQSSSTNGDPKRVPERFIRRAAEAGADDELPSADVPVIDLSLLPLDSTELQSLRSALTSWGCFQVINHGMTCSFLDQVREAAKDFFALPSEEKRSYLREDDGIEGYGTDMILSDHQVLDWNGRLYLTVYPEDQRKLQYWPQTPATFRELLDEYTFNLKGIHDGVFKAMAMSLDLGSDAFLEKMGVKVTMFARFNHYPRCPRPELVNGLKPHADGSSITILLPDKEVEGLQILKENRWFKVPIIPHAILVNVGDQVEIVSNGVFKSPIHRAIPSLERDRISLAMFCTPDADVEIEPASELIDESRPRLYKTVKNYPEIYFHYYQQGKRPIDAVKL